MCMINVGYGQCLRRFAEVNVHLQSAKNWAAAECYIALYFHDKETCSKYSTITERLAKAIYMPGELSKFAISCKAGY
ncbi:hypothetical protein BH20BAC1_BH20BAC1_10360 [soil metagenome]